MKKIFLFLFMAALLGQPPLAGHAETVIGLPERLSGRILLQVEAHGEAWYVYPVNRLRYYLGRPADAFRIMRELGLGVSESDYDRFKDNAPSRLLGRILLRVQAHGEAYYVDPVSHDLIYLGRPDDAFRIMREEGLGITNANLSRMPISGDSVVPPNTVMNIIVNEPDWDDEITNPVAVSGQARVFENTVNIRLRSSSNRILASAFTTASSTEVGEYGDFSKSVPYSDPGTATGFLEVFTISAQDGSEIDKVITLVRF
ncbi:MAG: Gmad2 immunoglobulin-like domain-containing protein [Candidatus Falkowbacteria bacterium]